MAAIAALRKGISKRAKESQDRIGERVEKNAIGAEEERGAAKGIIARCAHKNSVGADGVDGGAEFVERPGRNRIGNAREERAI